MEDQLVHLHRLNILNNHLDYEGLHVLDIFCGTGNIAFEFASREARLVTAIDKDFHCTGFIKNESVKLGLKNLQVIKTEVYSWLKKCTEKYDLIFADPPYDTAETKTLPDLIFSKRLLKENGILIVEHGERESFDDHPNCYTHRNYGNVHFSFFRLTTA